MNCYFLVEGRRTEAKVYPAWLAHLVPELSRVRTPQDVRQFNYFLISGQGWPWILGEKIGASIADIRDRGNDYQYFIVVVDGDGEDLDVREDQIRDAVRNQGGLPSNCELRLVVQDKCIESWFLGHRTMISRNPQTESLRKCLAFYNVVDGCPECMQAPGSFGSVSQFHLHYLKQAFFERGMIYSKRSPGQVCEEHYLMSLRDRVSRRPGDLRSFQSFVRLASELRERIQPSFDMHS